MGITTKGVGKPPINLVFVIQACMSYYYLKFGVKIFFSDLDISACIF